MTQFCRLNGRDDGGGIKWKEGIQESEWFGGEDCSGWKLFQVQFPGAW